MTSSFLKNVGDSLKQAAKVAEDGIHQVSKTIEGGVKTGTYDAQKVYEQQKVESLKASFGKAAYDLAAAGDWAGVTEAVNKVKAEIDTHYAKINTLNEKIETLKAAAAAPSAAEGSQPQQVRVTIPAGCEPGSSFAVQLPSGAMHTATVPRGKRGGDELIVDVPLAPVAVVVGTPVSVE